MFTRLQKSFNEELNGKTIAIWRADFKSNNDDTCETLSCALIEALWKVGAKVRAFDPRAMKATTRFYGDREDLILHDQMESILLSVGTLVICTDREQFRAMDLRKVVNTMKTLIVIDGRKLFSPRTAKEAGITYVSLGR